MQHLDHFRDEDPPFDFMAPTPNPDDAPPRGIPFRDVPPGRVFRTAEWHRYTKRANGTCVAYSDGGDAFLEGERECFLISLGGWLAGKDGG